MAATDERPFEMPRLGHVTLRVTDVERSEAFYRDVLGLAVGERRPGRATFFTRGEQHHDLAVFAPGEDVPPDPPGPPGLGHFALKLPDFGQFKAAYQHCKANGVQVYRVENYPNSRSFYIKDPDGIGIEIYCDGSGERGSHDALRLELDA
jgi:catechol 2,3-dioxygenase